MKILFISRAFPPIIGGIEKQNYEICCALSSQAETFKIVNTRGKQYLPVFFFIALWQTFRLRKHYDLILLGDGVLALVAYIVKLFSAKPIACIVHGLDITFASPVYRHLWLKVFFPCIDLFIAVGNETIRQAAKRGLDTSNFTFIPNGAGVHDTIPSPSKKELVNILGFEPTGPVLLTLGRLVKRKGVAWFIREVFPWLDHSIIYCVAGQGEQEKEISNAINNCGLQKRIRMLGPISDHDKGILLASADLFIQPNIRVANDMEGFGLVVLEAALHGTMVIASRLEGLEDAITDGKNGILVESGNSAQYQEQIALLLSDPELLMQQASAAQQFVKTHYGWDGIARQYLAALAKLLNKPA